jgi:pimeloyl-ACP methyl ester carboxylesterase
MKLAQHRIASFVVTEHQWSIPVDHHNPTGPTLTVFAREVTMAETGAEQRPWLMFLQGGPGFEATRPIGGFGWVERAARDYRVLLLDQRGTGRSSAVDAESIATVGDADAQASYLRSFRSDAIVRDCEFIRTALGVDRWSVLGQSFGGFCLLHYLSAYPESLREGFFTGGIPPIGRPVDDVYRATYTRMLRRNDKTSTGFASY